MPKLRVRTWHELTAAELKRAAHAAVVEKRESMGERVISRGFVNLELKIDEKTDRVLGARVYYTNEMDERDDPKQKVKV